LNSIQGSNGTAHFLLFIDYRGHHRKGMAIYNATEGSLQQKNWFCSTKKVFLNIAERVKLEKDLKMTLFLS
jgi:hypothetical protein